MLNINFINNIIGMHNLYLYNNLIIVKLFNKIILIYKIIKILSKQINIIKKEKSMRYFILILGVLIILDIIYFSFINQGNALVLNYEPLISDFRVESGLFYFLLGFYGVLGGILITYSKVITLKNELKKYKRKTEKSSIESEESQDRVKELESKVNTLETALKDALNKK